MNQTEIIEWLRNRADQAQKWADTYPELTPPRNCVAFTLREAAMLLEPAKDKEAGK